MDNTKKNDSALARLRPTKRKLVQLYAALLYNCHIKGFTEGDIYVGPLKNACVPGINCYSCPGAVGACPLGALQNALASSTTRAPAYMFGIIILFGLLLGRTICGWLCPMGWIQELLYKIPSPKVKKNRVTRALSWLKYVILAALAVTIPLAYAQQHFPVPGFCKYICPSGTLLGAIGLLSNPKNVAKLSILNILFTRKFVILMLIVAGSIFVFRIFCRFLCPLGAIYGFFAKVALIGVRIEPDKCIGCGACVRKCKMDVRHVGDHECINCGECISSCPTKAIAWNTFGHRIDPAPAEKKPIWKSLVAWAIALAVLGGVIWFVNKPENNAPASSAANTAAASTAASKEEAAAEEPAANEAAEESTAEASEAAADETVADAVAAESEPATGTEASDVKAAIQLPDVGMEPGMLLPDFSCPVYGGESFNTAEQRGKVLILNFWATWCTPCVNELPEFAKIAEEYADSVTVIAIHSNFVTEDVDAWIAREQIPLTFGLDETGEIIKSYGGSTQLPMTVVVDANGVITYNAVGAVTYEKLEGLIAEAQASAESMVAAAAEAAQPAEEVQAVEAAAETPAVPQAEVGMNPGNLLPDFSCPVYGGEPFSTAEQRGKVMVLNFWATWCTPCVNELPEFAKIAEEYADNVTVIAMHSNFVTEDVNTWIAREQLALTFGLDETGDIIKSFGGSTQLPMTVVVDANGIITYNAVGAVTYEKLVQLITEAQG